MAKGKISIILVLGSLALGFLYFFYFSGGGRAKTDATPVIVSRDDVVRELVGFLDPLAKDPSKVVTVVNCDDVGLSVPQS